MDERLRAGPIHALDGDACKRMQTWVRTAWARGHKMGMLANEQTTREAVDALRHEKDAHAETNAMMTVLLIQAESSAAEEIRRLHTLLADIEAWAVDQYITLPHDLRVRMQKELDDGRKKDAGMCPVAVGTWRQGYL